MSLTPQQAGYVGFAGNVVTAVCLVFVNKILMGSAGYGFKYATTLSALHFVVCSAALKLIPGQQPVQQDKNGGGRLPVQDLILFTLVADVSIVSLNLSLLLNPVSTYQIAKLLVIPFVCMVERFFFGKYFSRHVLATIAMVALGVAVVTVEEVSFKGSALGLMLAGLSVVGSGMQQILVRSMQQKHSLSSNELLGSVAPAQAVSLLLMGPPVDKLVTNTWVASYVWTQGALAFLVLSCLLAVGVNITQFLTLGKFSASTYQAVLAAGMTPISQFLTMGKFSASTYQVLGHTKTIMVLLGSWLFLGELMSAKKLGGG
ncbi:hypothetical protein N2152v2_005171 [Parachlorella kessleri]